METGLQQFLDAFQGKPDESAQPSVVVPWRVSARLTDDQLSELLTRYQAGETTRDLAEAFAIGKTALVQLLRANSVSIRTPGNPGHSASPEPTS